MSFTPDLELQPSSSSKFPFPRTMSFPSNNKINFVPGKRLGDLSFDDSDTKNDPNNDQSPVDESPWSDEPTRVIDSIYTNPAYRPETDDDDDEQTDNESSLSQSRHESSSTSPSNVLEIRKINLFNRQMSDMKESFEPEPEPWDKALSSPDNFEMQTLEWPVKLLKVVAIVVMFVGVLGCAIVSKCLILLMTSMSQPDRSIPICVQNESFYPIDPPLETTNNANSSYAVQYRTSESVHRVAWLWCLYFVTIVPYVFAFGRSIRICLFKSFTVPLWTTSITVFIMETLHCIGLSILIFVVLPNFDSTRGAIMMCSVSTIPSFMRLFVLRKPTTHLLTGSTTVWLASDRIIALFTFGLQILSLVAWTVIEYYENITGYYLVPLCLVLVSFEWWENYIVPDQMFFPMSFLDKARKNLQKSRYFLTLFISIWKAFLLFSLMILNEYIRHGDEVALMMFRNFTDGFTSDQFVVSENNNQTIQKEFVGNETEHYLKANDPLIPLYVVLIHIVLTYMCYTFGMYACKICVQKVSFAIPITLTIPVSVIILWQLGRQFEENRCVLVNRFPMFQYIFWYFSPGETFSLLPDSINHDWIYIIISVIWMLGTQFAVTVHIWKENSEKLAAADQLFVSPKYNAALVEQSMALNRRCIKLGFTAEEKKNEDHDEDVDEKARTFFRRFSQVQFEPEGGEKTAEEWDKEWEKICLEQGVDRNSIDPRPNPEEDDTVRVIACATMWHEDTNEMLQFAKSIMRLDFDQGVKRIAKETYNETDGFYKLEANIFFDNAFDYEDNNKNDPSINKFVEQFMEVINEAAKQVLGSLKVFIEYPTIVPTPFGGKLIWRLPSGNRLIAHIKDKSLIRDRKRWSQVMYMYYLLGHRLEARTDLSPFRKKKIANNTFILALDGDINFQPSAVHMLVDLMKKNSKLGAACGRIHPVGSGLIVWYQKFEYAIGHWFQKATEHVFGCVLCSPGCFSMFRARALLDDSVMHKYTTRSTEALHYVQYDQGEDRWLCTLMLQRGWRIEYSAASDSYTHAPEGFAEFFIQRRRWSPSTMANIIDLLSHYSQTVRCNENISRPYILYQAFLMFGSILSPATIILMVVTSMETAMSLSLTFSIASNLTVIVAYTFVCFYFKSDNLKINFAIVLSTIYALLMLAVLVGTGLEMVQNGPLSPNSLFFTAMIGSFLVAAISHPQEFGSVFLFPIYMLLIPSMYLLLTIYSVTNMHNVNWGTRENNQAHTNANLNAEENKDGKGDELKDKLLPKSLHQYFDLTKFSQSGKNGLFSCMCCSVGSSKEQTKGGLFSCMCCSGTSGQPYTDLTTNDEVKTDIHELKTVVSQMQSQITDWMKTDYSHSSRTHSNPVLLDPFDHVDSTNFDPNTPSTSSRPSHSSIDITPEFQNINRDNYETEIPNWIRKHPQLRTFTVKQLHENERLFWNGLIGKYLYPIQENREEEDRIRSELVNLRNKSFFAIGFLNTLVVLLFFMLQNHTELIVKFPIGDREVNMHPVGLWLVFFFGTLLVVQCFGMFFHRFGTLILLLAQDQFKKKQDNMAEAVKKVIQRDNRRDVSGDSSPPSTPGTSIAEEPFKMRRKRRRSQVIPLDDFFKKQLGKLNKEIGKERKQNKHRDSHDFTSSIGFDEETLFKLYHKRPVQPSTSLPHATRARSRQFNNGTVNFGRLNNNIATNDYQDDQQTAQTSLKMPIARRFLNINRFKQSFKRNWKPSNNNNAQVSFAD